jgi:outer membrane protein
MKNLAIIIFLSVCFTIGSAVPVLSADIAKIGVLNFQQILNESSAGKMTRKEINDKGAEFQEKLKTEKEQIDEMKKAFEREALVLSPEKQAEKQREFRIRVNDFKKMQDDFGKGLKKNGGRIC